MGNRNIIVVFFCLIIFSLNSIAQECDNVEVPFSSLDYVGINLAAKLGSTGGRCSVIQGVNNDNSAVKSCPGGYVINPGNPQYTENARGTLSENGGLGYYFCIQGARDFRKETMCNELKRNNQQLSVEWVRLTAGGDGNCICGSKRSLKKVDCAQADIKEILGNDCTEYGTVSDGKGSCICDAEFGFKESEDKKSCVKEDSEAEKVCKAAGGILKQFGGTTKKCYCEKEKAVFEPTEKKCGELNDPGKLSEEVVKCVEEKKSIFDRCVTTGTTAKEKCEEHKKDNKQLDDFKGIVKAVTDGFVGSNKNKGAKTSCVEASLIASGGYSILDMLKSKCDPEIQECTKSCDDAKSLNLIEACKSVAKPNISDDVMSTDMKYLSEKQTEFQHSIVDAVKACKVTAPKDKNDLVEVLKSTDRAAKAGQSCACQLSSSTEGNMGGDCLRLPGPAECATNSSLPGCTSPLMFNCAVGSPNYEGDACLCIRSPSSERCKPVVTQALNPSTFGADIKTSSFGSSGASFGTAGNAGKGLGAGGSGFDLSAPKKPVEIVNSNGSAAGLNGAGNLIPGSGGVGSSGNLGTGGLENRDPSEGSSANADSGTGSGIYGQAKSFFSSLLGSKDKNKDDANRKNGKDKKSDKNMDDFRPFLRGVAGSGGGSKNKDIFQIMNHRYNEDYHSFLEPMP